MEQERSQILQAETFQNIRKDGDGRNALKVTDDFVARTDPHSPSQEASPGSNPADDDPTTVADAGRLARDRERCTDVGGAHDEEAADSFVASGERRRAAGRQDN